MLKAPGTWGARFWGAQRNPYPPLAKDETIFVIGDLHGCADLLDALHAKIDAATGKGEGQSKVLEIYLGDYVDRGPNSAGVIKRLLRRAREREILCLRGNHEALFQQALAGTLELREWARYGGLQTLHSYGIAPESWRRDDWAARLRARVPAEHAAFLRGLFDGARRGDYFFAHAGVRPGVALEDQAPEDLHWIRQEFLDDGRDHGAVVVHGHTPTTTPELRRNRINLDTGAFLSGRLSCLRIDREGARLLGDAGASLLSPAASVRPVPRRLAAALARAPALLGGSAIFSAWRRPVVSPTERA